MFGEFRKDLYMTKIIPLTFKEAMSHLNCQKWEEPIKTELQAMERLKVFDVVPRTSDMIGKLKPVPTRWIFTIKYDGTHKARIVAQGHKDPEKYEPWEKESPTPEHGIIK